MNLILDILGKNPGIGIVLSFGSVALPFINAITPYLQFLGIIIGLLIGILTVYIQIQKIKKRK